MRLIEETPFVIALQGVGSGEWGKGFQSSSMARGQSARRWQCKLAFYLLPFTSCLLPSAFFPQHTSPVTPLDFPSQTPSTVALPAPQPDEWC